MAKYKNIIKNPIYIGSENKGLSLIDDDCFLYTSENNSGIIFQKDSLMLDELENDSVHLILADHPYPIVSGTNRNFNSNYIEHTLKYTQDHFNQKARILKEGGFLVEFLPELKENNTGYIAMILDMAKKAGFNFYVKIPWYKAELRDGKLIDGSAFVGRKAVLEEVYIFSKGTPRKLRFRKQGNVSRYESGAKIMFPAIFMIPTKIPKKRIHKAEKPEALFETLINSLTNEGEVVLDQFAGSFNGFKTSVKLNRITIAYEIGEIKKMFPEN